jgi:hypothetical protein
MVQQGRYNDLLAQARGVNAVHRDEADADIFNIDRLEVARFDGLSSSTMNFASKVRPKSSSCTSSPQSTTIQPSLHTSKDVTL